jgi:hypothetical protein
LKDDEILLAARSIPNNSSLIQTYIANWKLLVSLVNCLKSINNYAIKRINKRLLSEEELEALEAELSESVSVRSPTLAERRKLCIGFFTREIATKYKLINKKTILPPSSKAKRQLAALVLVLVFAFYGVVKSVDLVLAIAHLHLIG